MRNTQILCFYKSSAVAEMGDCGHNRHGPKRGGLLCPFRRELGSRLIQCGLGRGLFPYQVAYSSIQPFGHNRHGALLSGGSWIPIEHNVAWAKVYLHNKWHLTHPAVWPQRTLAENWGEAVPL